jgi:hypothetical protein
MFNPGSKQPILQKPDQVVCRRDQAKARSEFKKAKELIQGRRPMKYKKDQGQAEYKTRYSLVSHIRLIQK